MFITHAHMLKFSVVANGCLYKNDRNYYIFIPFLGWVGGGMIIISFSSSSKEYRTVFSRFSVELFHPFFFFPQSTGFAGDF